jgi:hypothetical protein
LPLAALGFLASCALTSWVVRFFSPASREWRAIRRRRRDRRWAYEVLRSTHEQVAFRDAKGVQK